MIGDNPEPLTEVEKQQYRSLAMKGEGIPLEITRRFIATIRKSITSSPAKTEKAKTSRVVKTPMKESDIPF